MNQAPGWKAVLTYTVIFQLNSNEKQEAGDTFPKATEPVSVVTAEGEE